MGLAALGAYAFLVEPRRLVVTHHALSGASAGVTADAPVLRFVQLSDLHLRHVDSYIRYIAGTVNDLDPHLILITGDSVDESDRLDELGQFLDLLDQPTPKYAILGNWEHKAEVDLARLGKVYAARNCRLLVNESVLHRHEGRHVLITGLDDLLRGRPDIVAALDGVEPHPNHLILAHCPIHRDLLQLPGKRALPWQWIWPFSAAAVVAPLLYTPQYVLSGHTHGGQITLFGLPLVLPPASGRYVSGWYGKERPYLYVSRGLGTAKRAPLRLGAPPEIACFEWRLT